MAVIKRDGRWTVDFRCQGKRYRKKSPINTQKGAKEFERLLLQRLMQGEPLTPRIAKSGATTTSPTCEAFLKDWHETYAKTNNKPSVIKTKELIIRCHLSPFFGEFLVSEIGVRDLERFKGAQLSKGLSPKTINNQLSVLRRALRSAQEWDLIEVVPTIKWMKARRPDFDFLDFDEAERLFDATVSEFRAMVATALKAGLRLGELLALRQTDVDLVNGQIFVKRSVWKRTFGTPKNGLSRRVPIPGSLVRILKDHRHLRGELVFCQEDGSLLTRDMIKRVLPPACRKAGLDRTIQWHVLRHTFASHLVMRGEPLKVVQELLGHANIEATMIYAHLSESRLKQAVAKLDEPAPKPADDGHYVVTGDRRIR
jgi:integrase